MEGATNAIAIIQDEGTTTRDGEIDLISLGDAQFVLDWVNLPATASTLLNFVALCGDGFSDALVGTDNTTDVPGARDVTVASGFGQPDLILFLGTGTMNVGVNPWGTEAALIGMMFGAGIKDGARRCTAFSEDDGSASMDVGAWQQQAVLLAMNDAAPATEEIEVDLNPSSGWPTDGFELNNVNAPATSTTYAYLALKGTFNKALAARTTPTGAPTVNDDYNVGFSNQKVAICWGANAIPAAGSTAPVTSGTDLGEFFFGACDHLGNETFKGFSQEDDAADAETHTYHSGSKTLQMHEVVTPGLIIEADGSFTGTNFRLAYNDTDATSREFNALVLGWDAAADPVGRAAVSRLPMQMWRDVPRRRLGPRPNEIVFMGGVIAAQQFPQSVDAVVGTTATMVRSVGKIVSASPTATAATIVKQVNKTVTTSAIGTTASIVKSVGKTITASTVATVATITKSVGKIITSSAVATVATMTRSVGKIVSATVATSATMTRSVGKIVSVTVATSTTVAKSVGKTITATVPVVATVDAIKVVIVTISAAVGTSLTITKQVGKTVAASVATNATVTKVVGKTVSAAVATVALVDAVFQAGAAAAVAAWRMLMGIGR